MHPRTILAIARKDAIDILLNKSTATVLAMPIILSLVFLLISKLIGSHTTNILVYNPGQSRLVQVVNGSFDATKITAASSPAEVATAFGPDGSSAGSNYDIGLVIPANFESELQAGSHPQVGLYFNGKNLSTQDIVLIQAAITNYARQVANPQPPLALSTTTINPPSSTNIGDVLKSLYAVIALLMSFMIGVSLMPGLVIEEKERKTLRMLMVTPASFTDIILGKLLITLGYQLLLSIIVLLIMGGLTGQIPLVLLYILFGAGFSLALGALFGGIFSTASTAGVFTGIVSLCYLLPALFTGLLGQLLGNNPVVQLIKILPTFYIADGLYNATQNQGAFASNLLDISVILACTVVLLLLTTWVLRRQSSVAATI